MRRALATLLALCGLAHASPGLAETTAAGTGRELLEPHRSRGLSTAPHFDREPASVPGSFLSRDPLGLVDGPNAFLYARGQPVMGIDPLGLDGQEAFFAGFTDLLDDPYLQGVMANAGDFAAEGFRYSTDFVGGGLDGLLPLPERGPAYGHIITYAVGKALGASAGLVIDYGLGASSAAVGTAGAVSCGTGLLCFAGAPSAALGALGVTTAFGLGGVHLGKIGEAIELPKNAADYNFASSAKDGAGSGAMGGRRLGHALTKHGEGNTAPLLREAQGSGRPVGQWLDNGAAEKFIAERLDQLKNGAKSFDLPEGLGRIIHPDGSMTPATRARLVPSGSGVKTAYPLLE